MRQTELSLSKRNRRIVDKFRSKGLHRAREVNRAHILAALDRKLPEQQIMEVQEVGRTALWRTRTAYLRGGLEFALHDEARPGKPKQYRAEVEAQVTALDRDAADRGGATPGADERYQSRNRPADSKENLLILWRKLMWCIGELTEEYRRRMYELLDLDARPHDPREPVVCLDEKCKQLLRETRRPVPAKPEVVAKQDYECNLLVAVKPRGQRRFVQVTARRTKVDFFVFVCRLLRRIEFHYTPAHASWLNIAEIKIAALQRQCLARWAAEPSALASEVAAWQRRRYAARCGIDWTFRRRDADRKLQRYYVS